MVNLQLNRIYFRALSGATLTMLLAACGGTGADGALADGQNSQTTLSQSGSGTTDDATDAPTSTSGSPTSTQTPATTSGTGAQTSTTPAPATDSTSAATPYGQTASLYTLAFSDEFENGLNTNLWNDHMWYDTSNATKNYTVENGSLKIWPQRDASGKFFNRTLDTDGHYYQTYGYFEIEAKLPKGKGTWPAFWVFNHIDQRRPEIDIMEAYAGGAAPWGVVGSDGVAKPTMYATTVWKDANVQAGFQKNATPDLSADFHKYALKWEANKQTFYFDGKEVYSLNVTMPDKMYIMLDLWYGSASGTPDNSTPTGKTNSYEVKYVRSWKFK